VPPASKNLHRSGRWQRRLPGRRVEATLAELVAGLDLVCNRARYQFMNSRNVLAGRRADGWEQVAQKGNHIQLRQFVRLASVTLRNHVLDAVGTSDTVGRRNCL
jgi:predicted RNA binding protein YcfA (HicA-like mRNA interferase family)